MPTNLINKAIIGISIKLLLFFVAWFAFYEFIGKTYIDPFLTYWVTNTAGNLMGLFQSGFDQEIHDNYNTLLLNGQSMIEVGDACNGMVLYPIFIGFIFLLPGDWKKRAIFILFGSIIIFFANMLRVVALVNIYQRWPAYLDFNHRYTFTLLVYGVIFGLWMLYVKSLDGKSPMAINRTQAKKIV